MIASTKKRPRVGIMGPGRSGKDEAANLLAIEFGFRYAGSTSVSISREIARREGIPFDAAHARRHAERERWAAVGDEMTEDDPAALARGVLSVSELVVGVRRKWEMEGILREGLLDFIYWVDKPGAEDDPTQEFGPELCHAIVPNHWGLTAYLDRWRAIGRLLTGDVLTC